MTTPLLTTKLYIPPLRPNLVPRLRLVERLNAGLRQGHRLTLVAAPAGFGKTTLLSEWISRRDEVTSPLPVAWLSLDEGDNDPARFFTYLIAALQQLGKDVGQATQSLLGSPQMPPPESLTATLVNDIAAIPAHFVLVLDDYQLIHTGLIHDALAFLLDHQPPQMHLLIATRTDPPLPLPRLRVRGQMTEIRADDLRFTEEEAATFLNQALGLPLDAEKIAALEARTEGWIAGLQLAALSMQSKEDIASFVDAFSGSNRHIIDYLTEEVLAQQPEEIRDFLHQTSILDRFCAPLCDAVRKADESADRRTDQSLIRSSADSQTLLEHLERQNLFLVPLDDRREWYRYHRLFADFLRTELTPEQSAALHLRAAHRLGSEEKALEYLEQALHLAAPEDYVRAFLDEDSALAQLLPHARHVAPEFVDELLAAFEVSPPYSHAPTPIAQPLVDPLSGRELEVLRLMAANLSAPEIARELVIAVSTVRSHIKHIYGKLDAHSRYEAVERARVLGLL